VGLDYDSTVKLTCTVYPFIKLIQIPEIIISQLNNGATWPMLIHLNKLLLATAKAIVNIGPDML